MSLNCTERTKTLAALLLVGLFGHASVVSAQTQRIEDPAILAQGQQLFQANCAVCHGQNAQGITEDWRVRDENGKYPPPPLNGTAHTWHHSLPLLIEIIENGSMDRGGSMPPLKDKLSRDQVLMTIIWISSLWPDEIYAAWAERNIN